MRDEVSETWFVNLLDTIPQARFDLNRLLVGEGGGLGMVINLVY